MKKLLLTMAAGCLLAAGPSATQAQELYSTSFENPPFTIGDLDGQDGWSTDEGTAQVVSGPLAAADGSQYLAQGENSEVSRGVDGATADLVLFRGSYQGTGSNTLVVPDVAEPVAVLLGFRRVNDSTFTVAAYDGDLVDYVEPSPAITFANDEWAQITALIDYDAKTFSLSVNNDPYLANVNFADPAAEALGGFKSLSASASNADALGFFATDGDFDGDGIPDADEIATPGLDPFEADFPEVLVTINGTSVIPDSTQDLGTTNEGGPALTGTITISNDALAPLTITNLSVEAPFSLDSGPNLVIEGNGSADVVVSLPSSTVGSFSGLVSFDHNDPSTTTPFEFTVTGEVTEAVDCPGDLNGDGLVNIQDLGLLASGWGTLYGLPDLGAVAANWGRDCR